MASPEAREAPRERNHRHGVSRNGAPIYTAHRLAQPRARHRFDRRRDLALHGMVRRDIALRVRAHRAGKTEEARVFARAIVVQSGRRPPRARKCPRFLLAEWPMNIAFEHPFIVSNFGDHRARGRDMILASRVRRAAERNLLVAEPQAVRGAARAERQGLQRLDRGARINRQIGVAKGHHHPAVRIDDRAGPAMSGFDEGAARRLDNHWVGHRLLPHWRLRLAPSAILAYRDSNESKEVKADESKIAFICFHLFFRIGTFQCVTDDSNRKNFSLRLSPSTCAKRIPAQSSRIWTPTRSLAARSKT